MEDGKTHRHCEILLLALSLAKLWQSQMRKKQFKVLSLKSTLEVTEIQDRA